MRKSYPRRSGIAAIAVLTLGVVVLLRGLAYRNGGTLATFDLPLVVPDLVATGLGFAFLALTLLAIVWAATERYLPIVIYLVVGSVVTYTQWEQLPSLPAYYWLFPAIGGAMVAAVVFSPRSKSP